LTSYIFSVLNNIPVSECIAVFLIHFLTKEHLGHFQLLAIMKKATTDIRAQDRHRFSISKHQGARLLHHMVKQCLVSQEANKLSSKVAVPSALSRATNESSCCFTHSPALRVVGILGFGYSVRQGVRPCFLLHFPEDM
jgi:hypothetical protein